MNKHSDTLSVRRLKLLIYGLLGILLALILAVIVISGVKKAAPLDGVWTNDKAGRYRFNGMGQGHWISEDNLGQFNYENDGKKLTIDFVNDQLPDCIYTYRMENGALVLTDEQGVQTVFDPVD